MMGVSRGIGNGPAQVPGIRAVLEKDDKVMTTGGIYGRITKVDDDSVTVQVADNVRMRFARQAIQTKLGD